MPNFVTGQEISTSESNVEVTVTPSSPLPPGRHKFQLVVVDDSGNQSEPATVEIVVIDDKKPTAVIDAPATVPFGASFKLSGARSSDLPPGKIVRYQWLRLS
ncbi:hypothetical protein [Paucibacter sp. Y2R2-4]|uniref:hypothetical protein n=1 Tax=Paucibacter sp. Y2R2-4 TaxID=2893553 RepID=UPI0021E3DFD8|nr:hypothetical protein [Paucibacter sp. Y2R2-4]MCV2352301.1 hypothetical protein [Paucibacter sp. Y2R2-4]